MDLGEVDAAARVVLGRNATGRVREKATTAEIVGLPPVVVCVGTPVLEGAGGVGGVLVGGGLAGGGASEELLQLASGVPNGSYLSTPLSLYEAM